MQDATIGCQKLLTIRHCLTGAVIFEDYASCQKDLVLMAISQNKSLAYADLPFLSLYHCNLRYADFSHANLQNAQFDNVSFEHVNFAHADLSHVSMELCQLYEVQMSHTNLTDVGMCMCKIIALVDEHSCWCSSRFDACIISSSRFKQSDFRHAQFTCLQLEGNSLLSVQLDDAVFASGMWWANSTIDVSANRTVFNHVFMNAHCEMLIRNTNPSWITPHLDLLDQVGPIRMYKLVTKTGEGPFVGGMEFVVGQTYTLADADTNPLVMDAPGIYVGTLLWCIRQYKLYRSVAGFYPDRLTGVQRKVLSAADTSQYFPFRILIIEFTKDDIACIPIFNDGQIRLRKCTVVGEKNLAELGLESIDTVQ